MGRFTFDMIKDFTGFNRIFTILARGYLFHGKDGSVLPGDPYERIDYAYRALCAWNSVPDRRTDPKSQVDFRELTEEFPELVDAKGNGWYIRHAQSLYRVRARIISFFFPGASQSHRSVVVFISSSISSKYRSLSVKKPAGETDRTKDGRKGDNASQ